MDFPISVPSIGLVDGKFVDEDPVGGTPGSLIPAQWGNSVTEEILNVLAGAGLAPNEFDNAQLVAAIRLLNKQPAILADTGVAGSYAAVNTPPLGALPASGYMQRVSIANANSGVATYSPDGLPAKPVYGLGLQPLQGGELAVGVAVLMYLVQAGVNGGNGAWILIESLGGASQVAPATQSQHAMQLGQATGRLLNGAPQIFSTAGTFTYTPTAGMKFVIAEVQGAGGNGGGAPSTTAGQVSLGGGGASGGFAKGVLSAAQIGASQPVIVGAAGAPNAGNGVAGGASSIGSLISSPGGLGGSGLPSVTTTTISIVSGGLSSVAASGGNLINTGGQNGSAGFITANGVLSGFGGGSPISGGGGGGKAVGVGNSGEAATAPGAGGGGACNNVSSAAKLGGQAANGLIIIWEFS